MLKIRVAVVQVALMLVLTAFYYQLRQARRERDEARSQAAAWKQKDESNYPLAHQWRVAYEQLVAKGCK